jgi:DNA-binding transcriptional LysR family regulator
LQVIPCRDSEGGMNWDDLRVAAAIRDEGTFAGAAVRLHLDETTVARRLARLERSLDLRLFEAVDGRRRPTRHGEAILAQAAAIARHVAEVTAVRGRLPGPAGRFRIACTSGIAEDVLSARVGPFLTKHPGLTLQLLASSANVRFSRWEADLAVRLGKPSKGDFAISKLAELRLYLLEPAKARVSDPIVCAYPPELDAIPETHFLRARGLHERARLVTDNLRVIRHLVGQGNAVGVLPEYICDDLLAERSLRATLLPDRRDVWLLVQNHLRRDRAVRLVIDWLRASFDDLRR